MGIRFLPLDSDGMPFSHVRQAAKFVLERDSNGFIGKETEKHLRFLSGIRNGHDYLRERSARKKDTAGKLS